MLRHPGPAQTHPMQPGRRQLGPVSSGHSDSRSGILAAIGAYLLWGIVPLFWPLLDRSGALEILAHRIVWAFAIALICTLLVARRSLLRTLRDRRTMALLGAAALCITMNWGVYIWAVTNGQVLQAALGYYINPIFSILIGVIVLRERLAPAQWLAVSLAAIAVVVLTVDSAQPPWIALSLAASFGLYGVLKKFAYGDPIVTLTIESGVILIPAVGYLVWLTLIGAGTLVGNGPGYSTLLVLGGVATVAPLLCFSYAAPRIRLSTMAMTQYLAPTMQFILAVAWFHEPMSQARWVGFFLVWLALLILTGYALARRPR